MKFLHFLAQVQSDTGLPTVSANSDNIKTALSLTLGAVGAICVLIITIAGIQYVISQGDPQQTAKAKNTIIYAFVGLVIVMAAFSIVRYVVFNVA